MTTTLIILGRNNLNKTETYWTLWMWWRMWQKYTTTTLQMMMKVTMTTWMMKTPLPKPKGYDQRLSHRCRSVFVVVFVAFSPKLGDCVCVFGVCVLFSGIFLALVCVCHHHIRGGQGYLSKSAYGTIRAAVSHLFHIHNHVGFSEIFCKELGNLFRGFFRQLTQFP